jgi:hypothetical protein
LPKGNRLAAKADEIGVTLRTFARWVSRYEKGGEVELLSAKALQSAQVNERFELFEQVALDVMREHTDLSRPTREYVIAHTRARLVGTYGPGAVPLPSRATAYRILEKLEVRHPLFSKSTKRNRDIAARPVLPYGKLHPARPGEYLLMDTTCLDVFAMDPHSLRWVGVQLTVGMDWYSRCVCADAGDRVAGAQCPIRLGPRRRGRSGEPQRGLTARQRDNARITWFDGHKQTSTAVYLDGQDRRIVTV